ncbi:MAG: hypothetical protein HRT58_10895 [Crocinitomicaceae bacterium]|nr:hypothetical protein [Flavobacteriales bacterium]NQZ36162.1 hypothetical protein [Crocinitomicaceae bacterium]
MKKTHLYLSVILLLFATSCSEPKVEKLLAEESDLITISSIIPSDIDETKKDQLMSENKINEVRHMFDKFSWESFIAINWPVNENGEPMEHLKDDGLPTWYNWKEAFEVFRDKGEKPEKWNSNRTTPNWILDHDNAPGNTQKSVRLLFNTNKAINVADEDMQAFAGPLFDQNGNLLRYEVLMNEEEFDYILKNKLYNINGQIDFSQKNADKADFPAGVYEEITKVGAVEIKISWKVLVRGKDDFSRYLNVPSFVLSEDKKSWDKVTAGMVGFHINHKTSSASQWVWSTFEHVDNLATNSLETFEYEGNQIPIKPSFYDPDCETCPTNVWLQSDSSKFIAPDGTYKKYHRSYYIPEDKRIKGSDKDYYIGQAHRMIPIPERLQELNRDIQEQLKLQESPLQYYELVGTQWPKNQQKTPADPTYAAFPNSVENKPGGDPDPIYLTNMTMETYFQNGNQGAYNFMENGSQPTDNTEKMIFGTESCMGCHSSAGIANHRPATMKAAREGSFYGGQLSADFVWLLNTQAHWKDNDTLTTVIKPQK